MIKKSVSYFWKKRNKQKIGTRIYYDDTRIKRTTINFFGLPLYVKDEVLEIIKKDQYCI